MNPDELDLSKIVEALKSGMSITISSIEEKKAVIDVLSPIYKIGKLVIDNATKRPYESMKYPNMFLKKAANGDCKIEFSVVPHSLSAPLSDFIVCQEIIAPSEKEFVDWLINILGVQEGMGI